MMTIFKSFLKYLYATSSAAGPFLGSQLVEYEVVYFFCQITFFKSKFCVEFISELKNSKKIHLDGVSLFPIQNLYIA